MGSEMCIRDSACPSLEGRAGVGWVRQPGRGERRDPVPQAMLDTCLLYTSDAADERSSVDLGGRRIIKKKKKITMRVAACMK